MNILTLVFAGYIIGVLTGLPMTPLVVKLSRLGKSFFVCVNPRTKLLEPRWAKPRGEVVDFKFSDDTPKSVVLDGPLSHTIKGGRRAFLVNTQAGLAFNVETLEPFRPDPVMVDGKVVEDAEGAPTYPSYTDGQDHPGADKVPGKAGKVRTPHLNGARLNAVRKDTRIQQIAASNRFDLGAALKIGLVALVILGLMGIASLWMLSQLTKAGAS